MANTTAGKIRGVPRPGGGVRFLGIPYAQPPVGDLRWHEPLPAKPWSGVRDATTYATPCTQPVWYSNQHISEISIEDCLYLNINTQAWPVKKQLPVMVFIHGGGNLTGTSSDSFSNEGTLPDHGVVLVSLDYRLGIFGYFAHPGLSRESVHHASGNYGLMDQILALRWVVDNIANFGGDPNNITVFGQSAGALDIGLLMTSKLARGLFEKAISESGPILDPTPSLAAAEESGVRFTETLNPPAGMDAVKFLRGIPARQLLKAVASPDAQHQPQLNPDIDGWVLTRSPAASYTSGQEMAIPLLIGSNTLESGGGPETPEQARKEIQDFMGNLAPHALALYGLTDGSQPVADPLYGVPGVQWPSDLRFHCNATSVALWHRAAHHPVYEYQFDHTIPGLGERVKGAWHTFELPYVLGFFPKSGPLAGKFVEMDYKLSDLMETYWTNFAKTGNPNSDALSHWPELGESQIFLEFKEDGNAVASIAAQRGPQCNLYREALVRSMNGKQ